MSLTWLMVSDENSSLRSSPRINDWASWWRAIASADPPQASHG